MKLWADGRTTDGRTTDGRTPDHGHPISSPCEPNGSGELKKKRPLTRNVEMLCLDGVNWLDDRAIDLAQDLMKQQFPDVEGL